MIPKNTKVAVDSIAIGDFRTVNLNLRWIDGATRQTRPGPLELSGNLLSGNLIVGKCRRYAQNYAHPALLSVKTEREIA